MKERKFPDPIFVIVEEDGDDGYYLVAHEEINAIDDDAEVMVYSTDSLKPYTKVVEHTLSQYPKKKTAKA